MSSRCGCERDRSRRSSATGVCGSGGGKAVGKLVVAVMVTVGSCVSPWRFRQEQEVGAGEELRAPFEVRLRDFVDRSRPSLSSSLSLCTFKSVQQSSANTDSSTPKSLLRPATPKDRLLQDLSALLYSSLNNNPRASPSCPLSSTLHAPFISPTSPSQRWYELPPSVSPPLPSPPPPPSFRLVKTSTGPSRSAQQ